MRVLGLCSIASGMMQPEPNLPISSAVSLFCQPEKHESETVKLWNSARCVESASESGRQRSESESEWNGVQSIVSILLSATTTISIYQVQGILTQWPSVGPSQPNMLHGSGNLRRSFLQIQPPCWSHRLHGQLPKNSLSKLLGLWRQHWSWAVGSNYGESERKKEIIRIRIIIYI